MIIKVLEPSKKYVLTNQTICIQGHTLYKIQRIIGNNKIHGGYIESENNLSHEGDCWVGRNAIVYGDAIIEENAQISGQAIVCGNARISGNAKIYDNAIIYDNTTVYDDAKIYGNAKVFGKCSIYGKSRIFGNAIISSNYSRIFNTMIFDNSKIYGRCYINNSTICDSTTVLNSRILRSTINDNLDILNAFVKNSKLFGKGNLQQCSKIISADWNQIHSSKAEITLRCSECNQIIAQITDNEYSKIDWENATDDLDYITLTDKEGKILTIAFYAYGFLCPDC